jgi:tetrahydrodipicolinate N-succinyltransferase
MLPTQIERLFDEAPAHYEEEHYWLFRDFKEKLNRGEIRAAEPDSSAKTGWRTNAWVKKGILLGFRMGAIADMSIDPAKQPFFDKSTYPVRAFAASDGVRIVPGGSSIRDGSHIGRGVICMPPMFVVKRRAVLGTGTILNRSIPVYDLVRDTVYTATETEPLIIPEEAIVVPGSRAISHPTGAKWGLSLQAAVIVKYRDAKTEGRVQLEDLLR